MRYENTHAVEGSWHFIEAKPVKYLIIRVEGCLREVGLQKQNKSEKMYFRFKIFLQIEIVQIYSQQKKKRNKLILVYLFRS